MYQAQLCGANGTFYNSQTDVVKQNSQQNDEFATAGQDGNPSVGVAPQGTILLASASEGTRRPEPAAAWRTYRPSRGGGPGPNARDEEAEVYSPREAVMAYGAREAAIAGPASPAGAEATYYYWDHLGTVRMTAGGNPTAETVERHDYEPYGLEMGPATNTSGNTHQFTGHERDALGGGTNAALDYMHFRYYSPTAGRFMKPDNIPGNLANPQSWNKYSYVTGNPVNLNDPTGHAPSAGWLNDVVGGGDPWTNGGDSSKRQGLSNQAPKEDPPPPPPPTPPTQPPTPPTPPGPPPSEDPVPSPCDGTLLPGDKIPIALNAQKVGEIIYCFQDLRKDPVQTTPKGNGTQAINRGAEAGLKLANKVLQKETSILGGGGNICIEVSTIFRVPTCGGQLFVAQPQDRMRPDNPLGPFVSSHEQQIDPTAMPSGLAYNGPYLGPYPFAP